MNKTKLIVFLIALSSIQNGYGQVTIGYGGEAEKGALLQLKENENENSNSTKGLLLPRVSLTSKTTLVDISDVVLGDVTVASKHTGLTVYNTNESFEEGKGVNTWDGEKWVNVSKKIPESYFVGFANSSSSLLGVNLVAGSSWKTLSYNTVQIDSNSEYTGSSGTYKVKKSGKYNVFARLQYSGVSLFSRVGLGLFVKKYPGSTFTEVTSLIDPSVISAGGAIEITGTVTLSVDDELKFVYQSSGLLAISIASANTSYAILKPVP